MQSFPGFGFLFFDSQSPFPRASALTGEATEQDPVPCSTVSRLPASKESPLLSPGAFPQHPLSSLQEKELHLQVCFKEFQKNRNNKKPKPQPGSKITTIASPSPAALAGGGHTPLHTESPTPVCAGIRQSTSRVRPMQMLTSTLAGADGIGWSKSGRFQPPLGTTLQSSRAALAGHGLSLWV